MNRTKTFMLLAVLTALFLWIGQALGGQGGLVLAIVFAAVMNFSAYWFSDKIVLRMNGAREVTEAQAPELFRIVGNLSLKAGLPMPRVYVIPESAPNAFATGRDPEHAAVAVTQGLLGALNGEELEGVLAHELAHVRNRDTLVMAVAATLAGALSMLANMAMWATLFGGGRDSDGDDGPGAFGGLVGIIVAPIAAMLIQMAISRSREYMADEFAGRLTGNPLALASALRRIESWSRRIPYGGGSPATAHLFIINPFTSGGLAQLFSTHPSTALRVQRLEAMVGGAVPLG